MAVSAISAPSRQRRRTTHILLDVLVHVVRLLLITINNNAFNNCSFDFLMVCVFVPSIHIQYPPHSYHVPLKANIAWNLN